MITFNLNQRTITGICAFWTALFILTFIYTVYQWHQDWTFAHQPLAGVSNSSSTHQAAAMIAAIPDNHLFGKSLAKNDVPVTNLELRVTGIVKIEGEQTDAISKAYISISGQQSKGYQVGDNLPYGVKVYDITPETVILENDGRLEKLPLPRTPLQFKPKNTKELL